MALTFKKLQDVKDNQVRVSVEGPDETGRFTGQIIERGSAGKIIINTYPAFYTKTSAKESMNEVVTTIKNIKVNMAKGALPINTLIKISNLLSNKE